MGRRYRIELTPPDRQQGVPDSDVSKVFGSRDTPRREIPKIVSKYFPLDSSRNPRAYQVSLDIDMNSSGGDGSKYVIINGLDPALTSGVLDLNLYKIKVWGGFEPGLPLATLMSGPKSVFPLVEGQVFGAWGNQVGTSLQVTLPIISTGQLNPNITLFASKGDSFKSVITRMLSVAYPGIKVTVDISDRLVYLQINQQAMFRGLGELQTYLETASKDILSRAVANYPGIRVTWRGSDILISDKAKPITTKTIILGASEVMGNPVWTGFQELQVICPMRSDIYAMDNVTLPRLPTLSTGTQAATTISPGAQFTGTYQVKSVRHVGDSRDTNSLNWATILTLFAAPQ